MAKLMELLPQPLRDGMAKLMELLPQPLRAGVDMRCESGHFIFPKSLK
jgi:hypothetical protein